VKRKRFSKRQYGRTAERRGETAREMRTMTIASGGMGDLRNDTQERKLEGARRGMTDLKTVLECKGW
jgi:hypothetical protein